MKFFIDTEFHEFRKGGFFRKPIDTIELISIAITAENGRSYYAVCYDFDLNAAWDNWWLKDNVLKPIYEEFLRKRSAYEKQNHYGLSEPFSKKSMNYLLGAFGKSRLEIANELKQFVWRASGIHDPYAITNWGDVKHRFPVEFYGYYADYDWVVFCWLFGRMIDLPPGFPMYCKDLKQMMDERGLDGAWRTANHPDPENEHDALTDALWNRALYDKIVEHKIK